VDIVVLVDRILADGVLTRAEQEEFMAAVLADDHVSEEELAQMQRVIELIESGQLKVIE